MDVPSYENFELALEGTNEAMTVRVAGSPVGTTTRVPFVLPGIDDQSLKILVLQMRAVRGVRAVEHEVGPDARRYGEALFHALFHDDSLSAFRGSLHVAGAAGRGLRLRIRLSGDAVANVPWELLYDPERHRFPCQLAKYPITRYLEPADTPRQPRIDGPVRMLVAISSPTELIDLDVEAEWRRLLTAVQPLVDAGRLKVDRLPTASLDAVRLALLEQQYHIFHFIGHGGVEASTGEGILAFTDKYGRLRRETGHDLGVILADSPIRLAVLNSCEGARIGELDPYAGTAASLVNHGIPAVVAMQFEISDQAAIAFSSALYLAMTAGHPIDLAVTLARQAILTTSRSEWATPVLYLGTSNGRLFDLERPMHSIEELIVPLEPAFDLDASVSSSAVHLRWRSSEAGAIASSLRWEIYRDGDLVAESQSCEVEDHPPVGTHTYAVVAVSPEGRRSPVSESATATMVPIDVPAPARIRAKRHQNVVTLRWEQTDPVGGTIDHWEVLIEGSAALNTAIPKVTISQPTAATFSVVAISNSGTRSQAALAPGINGHRRAWVASLIVAALVLVGGAAYLVARPDTTPPQDNPTWHFRNISSESSSPAAASKSAMTSTTITGGRPAVYYVTSAGHLQELLASGETWQTTDLSAGTSSPAPRAETPLTATTVNGRPQVYYVTTSGSIGGLSADGGTWTGKDVSGGGPAASPKSGLASIPIDGQPRVYYLTVSGHVQELRWNGTIWRSTDLSAITAAVAPRADTTLTAAALNGRPHIYYVTTTGSIEELAFNGSTWVASNITVGPAAAPKSALTSITYNGDQSRVYYVSTNGHIQELGWDGSKWQSIDLSALTAAAAPRDDLPLSSTLLNGQPRVYYLSASGAIQELAWTGSSWLATDFSAGGTPAAANSPIISNSISSEQRRVYYFSSGQVQELD